MSAILRQFQHHGFNLYDLQSFYPFIKKKKIFEALECARLCDLKKKTCKNSFKILSGNMINTNDNGNWKRKTWYDDCNFLKLCQLGYRTKGNENCLY